MGSRQLLGFAGILALASGAALARDASGKVRIGVVSIQNRSGRKVPVGLLNDKMIELLQSSGFEAVPLEFQPPADVDHAAREAHCNFMLYTDVVHVNRTVMAQVGRAVRTLGRPFGARGDSSRDRVEVEVEFRLFAMDEVLPKISTSVQGKTARHPEPSVTVTVQYRSGDQSLDAKPATKVIEASEDPLPATSPLADPAKMSALTSALEKTVKTIRTTALAKGSSR